MTTIDHSGSTNIESDGSSVIDWLKNHWSKLTALIFWTIIILATRQYMQANELSFAELAMQLSDLLTSTWYGPLIYIAIYLLRPLILFPATLLTLLAGSVFGLGLGYLYALIAGTLSSILPYGLGRWFVSDDEPPHENLGDEGKESRIQQFLSLLRHNPFQAVLTMRLLFLPYDAVSLIVGSLRIGFIPFFLATALGNLGGTFVAVSAGASIQGDLTTDGISIDPSLIALSIGILVVSLVVSRVLHARQDKKKNDALTVEA